MKKIFLILLLVSFKALAVDMYNSIATAYVTTTISQNVVFDSTMQQGGTFTFSVLAHNGGGRAGQSDTANVKIQFYNASGGLVTSVNSSYSSNLPQPTASGSGGLSGNPQVDPAVPWTTLTTSATLSAAQASTVKYATISMYGVDGSYWAGDYGPWYRAPTFTLNGGGNMAYNPEFGPYNGITAQGWTSSPGFGACQGAWGGSNACIVNSSGTPGTSTVGLVANQNGGGPSATGGTTSGQPGGYNSAMTTTNAAPAPAPARTVTGTSISYTTSTTTSGNTTYTYKTPVTTTTYSDNTTSTSTGSASLYSTAVTTTQTKNIIVGTQQQTVSTPVTTTTYTDGTPTTTTNGTATTTVITNAAFTGVKFGPAQVADTQWNVYACTQTASCQIYSTAPGITYNTGSPTTIGSTQYITFVPNNGSDKASLPWTMLLVNSDGTYTSLGNSKILVEGMENGKIYMFVDNGQLNGTLLSGNLGLTGQGMTFSGIMNPSLNQTNTDAAMMSSSPLAAGQSGGTGAGTQGFNYTTYAAGGPSPSTNNLTALSSGTVSTINFDWGNGLVANSGRYDGVVIHYTGYFLPNRTGVFQFGTTSDDGAKLSVNGQVVVSAWWEQGPSFYNGSISLTSGTAVPIDLWYYENGGGAMIQLWWFNESTQQWEIVPANMVATSSGYFTYATPVLVSSSTTDQVTTSSSVGSTQTITNSYTLDSSTYTVTGTSTPTTVTTTTTPVTINTYSDGSTTTTYGTATTTTDTTYSYTVTGPATPPVSPYVNDNKNGVYITQINAGSANAVQANQSGHGNYQNITLGGSNNTINAGQGYTFNSIGIASESSASNFNVLGLTVSGSANTMTNSQVGNSNSAIIGLSGNANTSTLIQTGSNNQAYSAFSGNNNTSSITQNGNSNLASVNLYGNGNTASVSQTGNNHGAVVNLINAGGPNTATVIQTGNGDAYAVQQTCTNPAGCSLTVIRNK